MSDVVIVSSVRTPVGKATKGTLRATRPSPRKLDLPFSEERYAREHWPLTAKLREAQGVTSDLRKQVATIEKRRADLERTPARSERMGDLLRGHGHVPEAPAASRRQTHNWRGPETDTSSAPRRFPCSSAQGNLPVSPHPFPWSALRLMPQRGQALRAGWSEAAPAEGSTEATNSGRRRPVKSSAG